MKIKSLVFLATGLFTSLVTAAPIPYSLPSSTSTPDNQKPQNLFTNSNLAFLYAYTDFRFNSTIGSNYNRFDGHSSLYGLGEDNVKVTLFKDLSAGLFIYRSDTSVVSKVLISPGIPTKINQTNHNNTLFGHLLKRINQNVFIDLSGAYGKNKTSSETQIGLIQPQVGFANSRSTNWFTALTGVYTRPWKKFIFSSNARLLYSQINADRYVINFPTPPASVVTPFANKALFAMENVEVGYKLMPNVTPFINAGLVEVLNYKNSRPLITTAVNGSIPQLNMDKNGVKLGGGVGLSNKKWALRIEEQFYAAGGTFTSYQTLVGLKYLIS